MKNRTSHSTNIPWVNEYVFNSWNTTRKKIDSVLKKYNQALLDLIDFKRNTQTKWDAYKDEFEAYEKKSRELKEELTCAILQYEKTSQRNVLSNSNIEHTHIWHWQDNVVFPLGRYVYKESTLPATSENHVYLRNKYFLLKKFLWDNIPKTYFVLWESLKKVGWKNKKLSNMRIPLLSELTIQKRIQWPNLSQMSADTKKSPDFQDKLEKAHRKYILLKMFLERIHDILDLPRWTLDIKLDLWSLSDKDSIKAELLDTELLMTPNIMWDNNQIYFIDFDFGTWDNQKQLIFDYLMWPWVQSEWRKILSIYHLN